MTENLPPKPRPHQLKLYYADSQTAKEGRPIENATIFLVAADGTKEAYTEMQEGMYQLEGKQIKGETDKEYFLEIKLPNGKEYRSRLAEMPRLIKGDSTYIGFGFIEKLLTTGVIAKISFLEVFIDTPLPQDGQDYWLKWDVTTLFSFPVKICNVLKPPPKMCYISGTIDPQEVILHNGERFNASRLDKLKVSQKRLVPVDFEYRGRHYFLVNQQSITQDAHDYWDKINRVANQTGSIFDAPPAGIPGNIYNINDEKEVVLGYFELSNTDSLRAFVNIVELYSVFKFTTNVCPTAGNPFALFIRECCDCTKVENSSVERPWWF